MRVREPVVAGSFYAAEPEQCSEDVARILAANAPRQAIHGRIVGGLVPHAGWAYSGGVAAKVFRTVAAHRTAKVVVLFGGVHRYRGRLAAMFGSGRWESPLGSAMIDERLAERLLGHTNLVIDDPYAHEDEHSIEVQLPFVQRMFPGAAILPIMVPATPTSHEVGEAVARTLVAYKYEAVVVGTTDLTHYGPRYHFTPRGTGRQANAWAKVENDRRFIDMVLNVQDGDLVNEAAEHKNACSAGAAAATIAACKALGATHGELLQHTSSGDLMAALGEGDVTDSVGYAGVVFVE